MESCIFLFPAVSISFSHTEAAIFFLSFLFLSICFSSFSLYNYLSLLAAFTTKQWHLSQIHLCFSRFLTLSFSYFLAFSLPFPRFFILHSFAFIFSLSFSYFSISLRFLFLLLSLLLSQMLFLLFFALKPLAFLSILLPFYLTPYFLFPSLAFFLSTLSVISPFLILSFSTF